MSEFVVARTLKHFWIKITPAPGVDGAVLHGTLICEDSERPILKEAAEFLSVNSTNVRKDWLVDISRPSGPAICRARPVAAFIEQR